MLISKANLAKDVHNIAITFALFSTFKSHIKRLTAIVHTGHLQSSSITSQSDENKRAKNKDYRRCTKGKQLHALKQQY
jgi:hypothetical protein